MHNEEPRFLEFLDFAYFAAGRAIISLLHASHSTFKESVCLWQKFWRTLAATCADGLLGSDSAVTSSFGNVFDLFV